MIDIRSSAIRVFASATLAASAVLGAAWAPAAQAQSPSAQAPVYPARTVRLLLPVTAGGGMDSVARVMSQKLSEAFGQSVIVDNRPGAGGNIAAEAVARAQPDGHTLGLFAANLATNPALYAKLSYDPVRDFAPITRVSDQPYVLVVNPALPIRDVKEMIAFSRTRAGGLNYGSAGTGLLGHLSMEQLRLVANKFDATHIPYKGAAPALIDVAGGRVDAFFSTITSALPQVKAGRVRAIAVTSARRHPQLPDVPTVAEQGFPGFEVISWYGLFAPAGTPPAVLARIRTEVIRALGTGEVQEHMARDGAAPVSSTPEALADFMKAETARWALVVKESGATAQ